MEIIETYPPNYKEIRAMFTLEGNEVFTYGDTLYNPHKFDIPDHLLIHEKVHSIQQKNPERWWKRYLEDIEFRISQEVEAYGAQFRFIRDNVRDRNRQAKYLFLLASQLAGPTYGNVINHTEASKLIKAAAK